MSHATVFVALDAPDVERLGIEEALAQQMLPFDENGEWFRDGSRWDWYVIGGRSTGMLTDYDPEIDPENQEVCQICNGSGVRPRGLMEFGQAWYDGCHGCNGCHGKGMSTKWPSQWKKYHGDIVKVSLLDAAKLQPASAFLHARHWHEAERLGWFGSSTYTECERKDMEKPTADPDKWFGKCLHKDEELGAQVVCWNEPWEIWKEKFFHRFIEPLHPETTLVVVDYHV